MSGLAYVLPSMTRNPRRTIAYLSGTVIAVGLISSILFFVVASANVLTQQAIAPVHVDLQAVQLDSHRSAAALQGTLAQQPGIARAQRFALAGFVGAQTRTGNRIGQTASGKIMAVGPAYLSAFGAPVLRQGQFVPNGVVISQDMGTNLGARVGSMLTLSFARGVPPLHMQVTGIANLQNTDALFAPLDPLLRLNPFVPPVNVVIMNYQRFETALKPSLLAHAPPATPGAFVVRANAPVVEQVHLRIQRNAIPADPAQAKTYVTRLDRRLELARAGYPLGVITIVDNLAAALDQAQADVLWAQTIFVFLAIPGVVLAAALSRYVTATAIEAQRRELALLRIRGVGPRQLTSLLGVALFLVSLFGIAVGIGAGWLTTKATTTNGAVIDLNGPLLLRSLALAVAAGLLLGAAGTLWPLWGFIRTPIVRGQRRVERSQSPLWARLYLDIVALVLAAAVYEIMQANGGFQPVLNAEGNPTVSLSIFTFLSPLLFWAGSILFLVRISRWFVRHSGRVIDPLFRRIFGVIGELASRTIERRSSSLHQVVVLLAMGVAFGVSLLTFVHTYNQQQRVDAELTLGSDVKVSVVNRSQSDRVARHLNVAGVAATTPFRSTVAYVGSEIQDIFGIEVKSFVHATRLADSFFVGATAAETLHRLQGTPNGILVSDETARDFSLVRGDTLVLRLRDARTHRYVPVRFRLVGVAKEFATAPKDAFLVANLAYIQQATHEHGVDAFLIRTSGSPTNVAQSLQNRFASGPLVHVDDLTHVQQKLATSLSSLDLSALTSIDALYTGIMIVACLAVFSLAVLLERRRDFAMLQAMGATASQIQILLLVEVGFAIVVGCIFGLIVGIGFSQLLVQILAAIFDPPPQTLALPWTSVGALLALVVVSGLLASVLAAGRLRHVNLAQALRDAG